MTWNAPAAGEGDDEAFFQDMGAPVEDLMTLSDEQLGQLLGQSGVQVPVMLDDDNASADADTAAVQPDIDMPPATAAEAIDAGLGPVQVRGLHGRARRVHERARPPRHRTHPCPQSQGGAGGSLAGLRRRVRVAQRADRRALQLRVLSRAHGGPAGWPGLLGQALECGYDDYGNIRSDPDIASLRADARFEGIMGRFEPQGLFEGVFSMLSKGTTAEQRKKGGAPKGGGGAELIEGLFQKFKK
jgi:hypothetical protein